MNTFVCIKRVPDTSEAEVKVDATGKDVDSSKFSFDINDADNYAVEEAILIKEKVGEPLKLSEGPQGYDVMIRMALAKVAIALSVSMILHMRSIRPGSQSPGCYNKRAGFDLVLTGCMAGDDGNMAVGVALAEELGVLCRYGR